MSPPRTPREPNTPSLAVNRYPCEIRFQNLAFHVPKSGDGGLAILSDVTGVCAAKRMVAVMGPSGAGKSTLVSSPLPGCHFGYQTLNTDLHRVFGCETLICIHLWS